MKSWVLSILMLTIFNVSFALALEGKTSKNHRSAPVHVYPEQIIASEEGLFFESSNGELIKLQAVAHTGNGFVAIPENSAELASEATAPRCPRCGKRLFQFGNGWCCWTCG